MRKRRSFAVMVWFCLLACLVVASISLVSCGQGPASVTNRTLTFTVFDPPGSTQTIPFKLNASGEIVGGYLDSLGVSHGFLLQGGSFSTFDFPGAVDDTLTGINDSTQTTGDYDDSSGLTHGFLRRADGSVVTIDPPDTAGYTEANSINNSGTVVGRYYGNSPGLQGYLFSNGNYTTIVVPGATNTSLFGINNLGDMVGDYIDASGVQHGFVMSNGSVTTIDPPGSTNTNCQGINDSGEIVGSFILGNVRHGYLYSNGNFRTIDFPGASSAGAGAPLSGTDTHGINASGEIVGSYTDTAGVIHGFVAR